MTEEMRKTAESHGPLYPGYFHGPLQGPGQKTHTGTPVFFPFSEDVRNLFGLK